MTDTKNHSADSPADSLQGRVFRPQSPAELAQAIELAFDYRGDVTVGLTSGESVSGYLFNRNLGGSDAWIEMFPESRAEVRRIRCADIATLAFTGEDTASGKSWENWVAKKASERKEEADRVAADARARGLL